MNCLRTRRAVYAAVVIAFALGAAAACSFSSLDDLARNDAGTDAPASDVVVTTNDAGPDVRTTPSYVSAVLADGPAGYWRLDDAPGSTFAADSIARHDGQLIGSLTVGLATLVPNVDGHSMTWDGTSARIDLGDVFDFPGAAPFSIELWLRPDPSRTSPMFVAAKHEITDAGRQGWQLFDDNGTMKFTLLRDGVSATATAAMPSDGVAHHVVAVRTANKCSLYVDGRVSAFDGNCTMELLDTSLPAMFGRAPPGGGYYMGAMDEIAIYAVALTPESVAAHYAAATAK